MAKQSDEPLATFAAIEWQKRWHANPDAPCASINQQGDKTFLTTCLGFVYFDLRDDGPHILRQLEAACDLLRRELA